MRFTKMHGLGNDYVYIDAARESIDDPVALARAVSDRHTGIGSDGLILIHSSEVADVRMEMYNADGSRARMCGNGIRCVAKYAVEHGLARGPDLQIETDAGVRKAECTTTGGLVRSVRVDMGRPVLQASSIPVIFLPTDEAGRVVDQPLEIDGIQYCVTCVSLGNPHAVVFVEDLPALNVVRAGFLFEHHPAFPERINAHFAHADSPMRVTVRTWERGSGVTRACGTGACAVCAAGVLTGRTGRRVTVTLPGGDLQIEWAYNDHIHMTGPAVEVFTGEWDLEPA